MTKNIIPDSASVRILQELQRDARQTVQQIAERVGLSSTPCWKRIKDMEAAGVITGYSALVDRARVGLGLLVLAEVNLGQLSMLLRDRYMVDVRSYTKVSGLPFGASEMEVRMREELAR